MPEHAGARRLAVMLRHSTHLLFGLLWAVAMVETLHTGSAGNASHQGVVVALGTLEGVLYLAGLLLARRPRPMAAGRWRLVGHAWLASLMVPWMLLCGARAEWLWLAFPLYFLVFFLVTHPLRWAVVAAMALWSVASGLVREGSTDASQVVGPLIGAMVAVIAWIVLEQLRANVREQQRLVEQVRSTQHQLVTATEQRARDQERERLGRDLHDTLAQGLNSIIMLSRTSAARHPELSEELGVIEATARDNLAHARTMLHDMAATEHAAAAPVESPGQAKRPLPGTNPRDAMAVHSPGNPTPAATAPTLGDEVRAIVDAAGAREQVIGSGLQLGFAEEGTARVLQPDMSHALVMGVRSLVANVVQHAHATRCQVTLTWQADHVALDVVDDGVGFDPATATGYGLGAMRRRMDDAGATMELVSEPGGGCSVAITAPLPVPRSATPQHEPPTIPQELP